MMAGEEGADGEEGSPAASGQQDIQEQAKESLFEVNGANGDK